ncbi:hypothetical protein GLAREA_04054 [Glarea lozoyensis ATCC 20868]|uniref:Uncharacterized protein n=1 Tax=Glarea lozoyensis (strain ATCC 20868 / MF5171) TaxID=1116229 RepID=S3CXL8_GLAL2|nr:uncharacterized protein GLAREA_04054 [Glarea lozoyensis ATCC 20868]EPE31087.1 hypothetical protein GLAREA_04054 [Glarea lozoyensis ATCC 20868]
MAVRPPYLYDAIKTEGPRSPYKEFDPKAVTRASQTPRAPRRKQEGPLVSFNQHPDSYLILPLQNTSGKYMNPKVKVWVKWTRIIQLVLRCLQVLCAGGLLAFMIIIRGLDDTTTWILRIVPGVALLHAVYGIYHLSRKASGRTPASSAGYMLFASFFDVAILPFYGYSSWLGWDHQMPERLDSWFVVVNDPSKLTAEFARIVFLLATIGGGLHLISLIIGLYLAVTFRKITNLPPDMNPLEDNLTSRHKRNKSSISTMTTESTAEKRLSTPLESKRSSGAVYEDLSRPPTIPFFHTRTNSNDSLPSYKSDPQDSRIDLPSRQYQLRNSNGSSIILDNPINRRSYAQSTSPKRKSYQEVPLSDAASHRSSRQNENASQGWYASDSLNKNRNRSRSPQKGTYEPVTQAYDTEDTEDIGHRGRHTRQDSASSSRHPHASPLKSNPQTPRKHRFNTNSEPPLSNISKMSSNQDVDIADMSSQRSPSPEPELRDNFKARFYGDLKPATPPILVGAGGTNRQVSSGNDFLNQKGRFKKRDASGKIAEEGFAGSQGGWGTRFRKVSGI